MIVEVVKPDGILANDYVTVMNYINDQANTRIERLDKNQPSDRYVCQWDDSVAPVPTEQEMLDANLEVIKIQGYNAADVEGDRRIALAEANPSVGVNLDERRKKIQNNKRNVKANKKVNAISDADDNLYDHIDQIYDSVDQRYDAVEAASDVTTLNAIIADIPNDANWPTWSPI